MHLLMFPGHVITVNQLSVMTPNHTHCHMWISWNIQLASPTVLHITCQMEVKWKHIASRNHLSCFSSAYSLFCFVSILTLVANTECFHTLLIKCSNATVTLFCGTGTYLGSVVMHQHVILSSFHLHSSYSQLYYSSPFECLLYCRSLILS